MDKKAQGFKFIDYMLKLIFLLGATVLIAYLIGFYIVLSVQTQDLRAEIFMSRALYSPTGMVYIDPITQRPYPHTIDIGKFSSDYLESSIDIDENSLVAAKLELEYGGKNSSLVYNEERYDKWEVGVLEGDNERVKKQMPVLVYDGSFRNGILNADIIAVKG